MEKQGLTTPFTISLDEMLARRQKFAPGQTVRYSSRYLRDNTYGRREKEVLREERFMVVRQEWSSRRILVYVLHVKTNAPSVFYSSQLILAR